MEGVFRRVLEGDDHDEECGEEEEGHDDHDEEEEEHECEDHLSMPWLFAMLAWTVIGVTGTISAICIGPRLKGKDGKVSKGAQQTLKVILAFAAGTFTGDAMLHIIPHSFEAAASEGEEGHDDHRLLEEDEHDHGAYLKIGLAVMAGIMIYLVLEVVIHCCGGEHSHGIPETPIVEPLEPYVKPKVKVIVKIDTQHEEENGIDVIDLGDHDLKHGHEHSVGNPSQQYLKCESPPKKHHHHHGKKKKTEGYLIIMAIFMEHIFDGIALGIVFNSGPDAALSTFIAVWAHEIPGQMGCLGILINAGWTSKAAIWWNIILNVLTYFGVAFGLAIGALNESFELYGSCVVAGAFLYIGMTSMLPQVLNHKNNNESKTMSAIGFFIGVGLLYGVTLLE